MSRRSARLLLLFLPLLVLFLTLPVCPGRAIAAPCLPDLEELESFVGSGPEVLAALAELDRDSSLLGHRERAMGPRVFAGLTYGAYDEPESETSDNDISYQKLSGRAGVSFPILGSWNGEKIDRILAEIGVLEGRQKADVLTAQNLTALRKAYAVLWVEDRRRDMLDDFLSVEDEARRILLERTVKGFLLETDRLDFMAAFDLARQERAAADLRGTRALEAICLATGKDWCAGEVLPPLVPAGERRGQLDQALEAGDLPELRQREGLLAFRRQILDETRDLDLEGNVDLGVTWGTDFPGGTGTGVYVSLSVKEPFGTLRADDDKAREAAEAEVRRVRQEGLLAQMRARGELMESLSLYHYGLAALETSQSQMEAACESIRMNRLRHEKLPGDTYEKLLQSRNRYMKDALALFDAEALVLQTEMELLRFAYPHSGQAVCDPRALPLPDGERRARLLDPAWLGGEQVHQSLSQPRKMLSSRNAEGRTAYVWWADPFLDTHRRRAELERLREAGFSRMLLSFTAGEVRFTRTSAGRSALNSLLEEAREQKIRVDLLLGDPAWILPGQRPGLLALVDHFASFPFAGIHLDLEPDSLPGSEAHRAELLKEMLETVGAVRGRTPLPLSLSIHPRYLEGDLGVVAGTALDRLDLEGIAVMIYSTGTEAVIQRFRALAEAWPRLRLGLAQSVEKVLAPAESYASLGQAAFEDRMATVVRRLEGDHFAGLFIQAWKDYREMTR